MSDGGAANYIGPPEIRDATVVGVFRDGPVLRVILATEPGPRLTLTFRDVSGVIETRGEGMTLAGLARSPVGDVQRFVFVSRKEADDACLEVVASGFEISSSP